MQAKTISAIKATTSIALKCPSCRQFGVFLSVVVKDLELQFPGAARFVAGQRRCPDPECLLHIFFVRLTDGRLFTYPEQTIDFDPTNIPSTVIVALEEAIICHAHQCYVASAIMVRKTLEELCNERQAAGNDLKRRLADLGTKVVLPKELYEGLDNLRLLGNDAAHVESQHYNQVGKEESELAIEMTKVVLKAVYQYSSLLARLKARKKAPPP